MGGARGSHTDGAPEVSDFIILHSRFNNQSRLIFFSALRPSVVSIGARARKVFVSRRTEKNNEKVSEGEVEP
jgi:hypothetical protein